MPENKIPVFLVLGYLGSGKTTFINHFLQKNRHSMNIGLVQNDFAPAGIDAEVLRISNPEQLKILEINGGSVFCVCRIDSFIPSLTSYIQNTRPDILLVEASGMSEPMSLAEILDAPSLRNQVYLGGIITLADAGNLDKLARVNLRVRDQLRIADLLLLNKTDRADNLQLITCRKLMTELNPIAKIVETRFSDPFMDILNFFENRNQPTYLGTVPGKPAQPSGLSTAVIRSNRSMSKEGLEEFIHEWNERLIRMKGFVRMSGNKTLLLQLSPSGYNLTDVENYQGPTQIIAIGESEPQPAEFSSSFRKFCL